jgi:hypothetical protein
MGRAKVIKAAIQDRPAKFTDLTTTGKLVTQGSVEFSGSISTVSSSIQHIDMAGAAFIDSSNSTLTLQSDDGTNIKITDTVKVNNNVFAQGFNGSFTLSGSTASTTLTVSSSFTTTLSFSTNRIMATHSTSPLTMSIDADTSILGNVIMTDISSSGLNLPSSEFKVLNGTFDTTKRNYVYYHYIGNDTALVTINQES